MVLAKKQGPVAGKHNCLKEDSTNRLTLLQLAERTGNVSTNFINKNRLPRIERSRGVVRCSGELKEKVTAFSLDATTPCWYPFRNLSVSEWLSEVMRFELLKKLFRISGAKKDGDAI